MAGRRTRIRSPSTAFIVVTLILVSLACTGASYDEVTCEQAVSKLTECCPGVDPRRLPCVDTEGGCTSGEAIAVVSPRAGECILDLSCEQLRATNRCERIAEYALVPHARKERSQLEAEVCE